MREGVWLSPRPSTMYVTIDDSVRTVGAWDIDYGFHEYRVIDIMNFTLLEHVPRCLEDSWSRYLLVLLALD